MKYQYDCCVLGGGAAGLTAAKGAAGLGKKVIIVENNKLGGECTLTGCVPSKALIKSAQVAYHANNLQKFGIHHRGELAFDTSRVMDHVRSIIQEIYATHTPDILRDQGIAVAFGDFCFQDAHTLVSENQTITADTFFLCTGSRPFVPPIEGLDQVDYVTNETFFDVPDLPKSMAILGGGPIGMEMACALNRLGVLVTVIEMNERILPREDAEIVQILANAMIDEGVIIRTGIQARRVQQEGDKIAITCADAQDNEHQISAAKLLIAVGRRPNVENLNLELVGVEVGRQGIVVDDYLRTTQKHIFACGDLVGPYQFSHIANYQARVAVRNAFVPIFKQKMKYDHVCWVTYTAPELATAGLLEHEAREQYGDRIRVYTKEYRSIDRAHTECELTGLAKFVCDKKGYLLGVSILGSHAGELMQEVQLGKKYGIKFPAFYDVIHAYPAYSDLILHASKDAYVDRLKNNFFIKLVRKFIS